MADFDGDVKLGVTLEPKDIKSAAKSLIDAVRKIFASGSNKELDSKFKSLQASMSKSADRATELQQKLSKLENTKLPTEEYKEIQSWLDKQQSALSKVEEKMEQMVDTGKNSGAAWDKMQEQVDQLRNSVEYGKGELQELVDTGKAFTLGSETSEYQKLLGQLNDVNNQQTITVAKAEEMIRVQQEAELEQQRALDVQRIMQQEEQATIQAEETRYSGLMGIFARIRDAFINVGSAIRDNIPNALANARSAMIGFAKDSVTKLRDSLTQLISGKIQSGISRLTSSITGLGKSAKSAHSPVSGLFKKFLMYGLGIRSIYMLVRKLRSAIVEGFKAMAQMNGRVNSTNSALSALQSSLSYVRNSWAAAFSPILDFVTPVLVRLMDMLAKAASYISMFLSLLGGKSTYRVAVKGQTDFAKSLGKTGGAADKAYDKLAPFDDLQVLGEDKNGGGGGGGDGLGDMFEDVPIDKNEIPKWLQELAELLRDLFDRIMESVARLRAALRNLWEAIKQSLKELWDEGVIQAWLESVANLIISIIDILTAAVESFTKAWVQDDNGTNYLRSLFEMLTAINNLLIEINGSIERAFRSDVGVDIFVNILQIFTHINNTIRNLADNFREAWTEGERGDQIIMSIFTSVDILLGHVNNVTAAIEKWSETVDFGPVLDGILLILQDIEPIVDDIGSAMEWLWTEILEPLSTWTIEEFIPEAFNIIAAALELMEPIIDKVAEYLKFIWDNFLEPAAAFVGDAIISFMDDFAEFLRMIAENETAIEIISGIATALITVWGAITLFQGLVAILSSPIFWIGLLIVAIVELITHWDLVKEKVSEVWASIKEKVQQGVENVKSKIDEFKANAVAKFEEIKGNIVSKFEEIKTNIENKITGIILAIGLFIGNVENFFITKFTEIKDGFNAIVQEIVDWITQKIAEVQLVIDAIVEFFTVTLPAKIEEFKALVIQKAEELKTNVTTAITTLKTSVETTITNLQTNLQNKFTAIKTFITTKAQEIKTNVSTKFQAMHDKATEIVLKLHEALQKKWEEIKKAISDTLDSIKEKWDSVWAGMRDTLKGIINSIIGFINKMISAVAEGVNAVVNSINSLAFDVPDWVPVFGGESFGLHLNTVQAPQIPQLAQGAVIPANHEFLAMLGDQARGTNIEAPLDTIVEAFREVVANMQVQNTGYSEMTLDGQTFARLSVPYIISELRREGYNVTVLEG